MLKPRPSAEEHSDLQLSDISSTRRPKKRPTHKGGGWNRSPYGSRSSVVVNQLSKGKMWWWVFSVINGEQDHSAGVLLFNIFCISLWNSLIKAKRWRWKRRVGFATPRESWPTYCGSDSLRLCCSCRLPSCVPHAWKKKKRNRWIQLRKTLKMLMWKEQMKQTVKVWCKCLS